MCLFCFKTLRTPGGGDRMKISAWSVLYRGDVRCANLMRANLTPSLSADDTLGISPIVSHIKGPCGGFLPLSSIHIQKSSSFRPRLRSGACGGRGSEGGVGGRLFPLPSAVN